MLISQIKQESYYFESLNLNGYLVKAVGDYNEVRQCYNKMVGTTKMFPVIQGHIIEYTGRDFQKSDFAKENQSIEKIIDQLDVDDVLDELIGTTHRYTIQLNSEEQAQYSVDAQLKMALFDDGTIFIKAVDILSEVSMGVILLVTKAMKKAREIGANEDTAVIIQATTEKGYTGLTKVLGAPKNDLYFIEYLNLDANLGFTESELKGFAENVVISDGMSQSYFDNKEGKLARVAATPEFLLMTDRGRRHVANLGKLSSGKKLQADEIQDLNYYLVEANAALAKAGHATFNLDYFKELLDSKRGASEYQLVTITDTSMDVFAQLLPDNLESIVNRDEIVLLGAVDKKNRAIGAMVVELQDLALFIEWIYVQPEMRFKGVGTFLLDGLIKYNTESMLYHPIEMLIDDNEDLVAFFEKQEEFELTRDATRYEISPQMRVDNSKLERLAKVQSFASPLLDKNPRAISELLVEVNEDGIYTVLDEEAWKNTLVADLCYCKSEGEHIKAATILTRISEKEIEWSLLYSKDQKSTEEVLAEAIKVILAKYEDYTIYITAINDSVKKLIETLFGEPEVASFRYIASWK